MPPSQRQQIPARDDRVANPSCESGRASVFSASSPALSHLKPGARSPRRHLTVAVRLQLAVVGIGLASLLALAAWLKPNPAGYGTHRQLGLPPCTFRTLVGPQCPSCGMTTSWAHVMRLELGPAVRANAAGTALALLAVAGAPWLLASAVRGRWLIGFPSDGWIVFASVSMVALTLLDWVRRLTFG